jgi:hypothetical protein
MNKFITIACFVILTLLSTHSAFSQTSDVVKQNFTKAERLVQANDYANALPLYLTILDEEPDNANINYRVGECYSNLLGQERNALPYLQKAVTNIDADYKAGNIHNTGASPLAWFFLGDAYHRNEMLPEASEAYFNYKEYVASDKKELEKVTQRIMGLGVSRGEVRDHPRDVVLTNLGDKINSKLSDYNIIFSGDMQTMVFNRYEKRKDMIFSSHFINGGWTDPVEISQGLGSFGDMYATALSYDGKELYVVLLTEYDADIYVSEYKDEKWQYAQNIGRSINTKYYESNVTISADGNTLYFSSDRATSIGGFDIYYCKKIDGKWGKAESIGPVINTKANEESPFITESGKTLYFSSDRAGSIGRMDIYFSTLTGDSWSEPENLGMPYNSVEDDVSFKYYEKYRKSYIARDLPGGFGKLDLYLIQSGEDRQREIADYMASLKPKAPASAPVTAVVAPPVATTEIAREVVLETEKTDETKVSEELEPKIPVVAKSETVLIVKEPVKAKETSTKTIISESKPSVPKIAEPVLNASIDFEGEYTIQVMALIFPKSKTNFKGLDTSLIRGIEGDDGYTRYIYGQYASRDDALNTLHKAFSSGYKDAFIRKTSEISNF